MAQNKIVISPNSTTVTVSAVGLTGPAGADGSQTFPYTGSAVISGSLSVVGGISATSITGSMKVSGSSYLISATAAGESGETLIATGSVYDNIAMIEVQHGRASNGTFTVELPDATSTSNTYRTIRFISDSSVDNQHQVDIAPKVGQTLDGGGAFSMNRSYEGIMVWSNGTEWFKIQAKNV